jgi:hypothetical protein
MSDSFSKQNSFSTTLSAQITFTGLVDQDSRSSEVCEDRGQGWSLPSDSNLSEGVSFCQYTLHMAKMSVGSLDSA